MTIKYFIHPYESTIEQIVDPVSIQHFNYIWWWGYDMCIIDSKRE